MTSVVYVLSRAAKRINVYPILLTGLFVIHGSFGSCGSTARITKPPRTQPLHVADLARQSEVAPLLNVTIRLIDAEADTAIANARLLVIDEHNGQSIPTSPDNLGFKFAAAPGSTLAIQASAPDYLTATTRIINLAVSQQVIIKLARKKPSVLTIKAFAVNISRPLSPATAVITSQTSGKSEQFTLKNGRLERRFTQSDKLDIQVSSPGYTTVRRQLSIDVPPTGNRYEFDAALDKIMPELTVRAVDNQTNIDLRPTIVMATTKHAGLKMSATSMSALPKGVVTTKAFGVIEKGRSVQLNKIYFDQSSPVLRPESYTELDQLYDVLTQYPSLPIEIRGYTDNQGDFDLNTQLSRNRCQAVIDYLVGKGIRKTRLKAIGRGPLDPVAPNNNEENRKKNRRVEFVLL